jgi:hypothetical protein
MVADMRLRLWALDKSVELLLKARAWITLARARKVEQQGESQIEKELRVDTKARVPVLGRAFGAMAAPKPIEPPV